MKDIRKPAENNSGYPKFGLKTGLESPDVRKSVNYWLNPEKGSRKGQAFQREVSTTFMQTRGNSLLSKNRLAGLTAIAILGTALVVSGCAAIEDSPSLVSNNGLSGDHASYSCQDTIFSSYGDIVSSYEDKKNIPEAVNKNKRVLNRTGKTACDTELLLKSYRPYKDMYEGVEVASSVVDNTLLNLKGVPSVDVKLLLDTYRPYKDMYEGITTVGGVIHSNLQTLHHTNSNTGAAVALINTYRPFKEGNEGIGIVGSTVNGNLETVHETDGTYKDAVVLINAYGKVKGMWDGIKITGTAVDNTLLKLHQNHLPLKVALERISYYNNQGNSGIGYISELVCQDLDNY